MDIKNIALTSGVAILFTLFIVFFIDAVYEEPKYEDYCTFPSGIQYSTTLDISKCNTIYNETLANQCLKDKGELHYKKDEKGCDYDPYCDYCPKLFNEASSKYNKNLFFISAIIGLIVLILGIYLPKLWDPIASGFIFGGIFVIFQGTVRVFGDLGKISRVIVLGIELVILIWIGYKKVIKAKSK